MTVLAVAAFQNSHIQERSAGNARLQQLAFEAASSGATNAIGFFDANREIGPDQLCGERGHAGWADPTSWVDMGSFGGVAVKQRMYCLADVYPCGVDDVDCGVRPARSQLFVLSRGEFISGNKVVASRDIEVRLGVRDGATSSGGSCGAMCLPGCLDPNGTEVEIVMPTSNAFQVDGNGGPAITGGCEAMTQALRDAIRDNRIGNYDGGLATSDPTAPWDTPENVEIFRAHIEATAQAAQAAGNCMTFCYNAGDYDGSGNFAFGTVDSPQVTYIDGDAEMSGNISGAGILLVNGNLTWDGTPEFHGLVVTLGGTYTISGGGTGGDHAGSLVVLNAPGDNTFDNASIDTDGGGVAEFRFDCDALIAAHALLDTAGQAIWSPNCSIEPPGPFKAGLEELAIISWRENIGWREEFFGSED